MPRQRPTSNLKPSYPIDCEPHFVDPLHLADDSHDFEGGDDYVDGHNLVVSSGTFGDTETVGVKVGSADVEKPTTRTFSYDLEDDPDLDGDPTEEEKRRAVAHLLQSGGLSYADASRISGASDDLSDPDDPVHQQIARSARTLQGSATMVAAHHGWESEQGDVAMLRAESLFDAASEAISRFIETNQARHERRAGIALADLLVLTCWTATTLGIDLAALVPERVVAMVSDEASDDCGNA